jgi:two-component system cell cycle sensor histidine kinase/response regulator CckA
MPDPSRTYQELIDENAALKLRIEKLEDSDADRTPAEGARLATAQRFQAIVDASPVPLALNDDQQNITFLNSAFVKAYGYTREDIPTLAHWWPQAYPDPAYRQSVAEAWQTDLARAKQTGEAFSPQEVTVRCKNGTSRIVLASAASFSPALEGNHLVVLYDITEHRQAEEALRESEEKFRYVFDHSPVSKSITLPTGEVHVNNAFCTMLGLSDDDRRGATWEALTHPDDIELTRREINALLAGDKERARLTKRFLKKDGSVVWADLNTALRRDSAGVPLYFVTVVNDITERKEAEEALLDSEERFREVFEQGPLAMITASVSEGRFIRANAVFCEMLGYTAEELKRLSFADVTHPDHRARDVEAVKRLWEGQVPNYKTEKRYLKKNGETVWGSLTASLIRSRDGKPLYSLAMIEDISERRRAGEEKATLEGQLQQAQKMESVGRLAGGVAHDFNNMLSVILGHAEVGLEAVGSSHPVHADLEEIHKAATRSADIVRQLLAFARKQTIAPRTLDLNETITGMLKMLGRLIGEGINLRWQPGADLWQVKIDPAQIDQILANMCVNARDAIAGVGRITVETENGTLNKKYCATHAGFVPGEYVRLAVSDDGCGMDKDILSHLFEPFFTTKGVGIGTGLGLATVYGIVKQNKGFIDVSSKPGAGTTFTIYLPRHMGTASQALAASEAKPVQRGQETILLVEDEPAILSLITAVLQRQGYTVLAASAPGEAIHLATECAGQIHLLITDVVMPEMNGRDLARNVQSLYPNLKRLFMSGYTADVIAHHGVLDSGVHFIQKPFAVKVLAGKVRDVLDSE